MLYIIAKTLRKNAGLTQKQAAEVIGITKRAWEMYEAGEINPKMQNLELFALKTNQNLDKIIKNETKNNPELKKYSKTK